MNGGLFFDASEWARNPEWSEKYKSIDFVPPKKVAEIAAKGLELRKKFGRGGLSAKEAGKLGIGSGVVRASSLKNRQRISPETIKRMLSFFARHEGYLPKVSDRENPTAAEISWMLWGGDEGREWARRVKEKMDKSDSVQSFSEKRPLKNPRSPKIKELIQLGIVKSPKQEERLLSLSEPEFCKVCEIALTKYKEKKTLSNTSHREGDNIKAPKLEGDSNKGDKVYMSSTLSKLYNNSSVGVGEKGQIVYPPNIATKYRDYLATGVTNVTKNPVSWAEVDAVWDNLSSKNKRSLCRKGRPPVGVVKGIRRGKAILKHLIETGFRDEITGQPYCWRDLHPDYKKPSFMFNDPTECENPKNFIMVHKGFNALKGLNEREVYLRGLDSKDGLAFVKKNLISEYSRQSNLTQESFESLLNNSSKVINTDSSQMKVKKERERQILENSLLWNKRTWYSHIIGADCEELKTLLRSIKIQEKEKTGEVIPIKFICTSKDKGGNYEYSATPVNRLALLLKLQVPLSDWPHGVLDRALNQMSVEIKNSQKRNQLQSSLSQEEKFDQRYKNRFFEFLGAVKIPAELREFFYNKGV